MAQRRVTKYQVVGPPIIPTTGIVPGCGQANIWAKIKLAPVIAKVVSSTEAQIEQYVDDLAGRIQGEAQVIMIQFAKQVQTLWEEAKKAKIHFAQTKSVVLASTNALREKFQWVLGCMGIKMGKEQAARDLGADRVMRTRVIKTQKKERQEGWD